LLSGAFPWPSKAIVRWRTPQHVFLSPTNNPDKKEQPPQWNAPALSKLLLPISPFDPVFPLPKIDFANQFGTYFF
jgi:hypothetical protein